MQTHTKVCSKCLEVPPPFIKIGNDPKYYEGSIKLSEPS